MIKNGDRLIWKILKEICAEEGIEFRSYCRDWMAELRKGDKKTFVCGYQLEINSAAAQLIARDKCAAGEILAANGVPAAEHHLFIVPTEVSYLGMSSSWRDMTALLEKYGKVVLKDNEGTGGRNVYKVENQSQLEAAAHKLFSVCRTISVSPFYEIEGEYRVIVFKGRAELVFAKNRLFVTGDGKATVSALAVEKYGGTDEYTEAELRRVPLAGEKVYLTWKHNLGRGAKPEELCGGELYDELCRLAAGAASAINAKLASVDVISVDGRLMVLEINSGIMMENFGVLSGKNYDTAKRIYKESVDELLR